ncbi:MAG: hypothetical protein KAS32_09620 [Candidatus Peribacteraceae bacterium]|nr:hypothetical protein [Candidatus Peribacteraceae bacterium]
MKTIVMAIVLISVLLLSGCVQQPTTDQQPETQSSEQTFEEVFSGSSNAKCVFETFDKKTATWWFKGTDFKFAIPNAGLYVKKGDYIYITVPGTTECKYYNIKEMEEMFGEDFQEELTPSNEEVQGLDSWVEAYKGYKMNCQFNVVTDADLTVDTTNCEDLTALMKETYDKLNEAMGELCTQCQENPEMFGGDCSDYCS